MSEGGAKTIMTENEKEPIRLNIEDVILNLIMFLWPECSVKKAELKGRAYRHICKMQNGNWKNHPIHEEYDDLPIYYFLLKGGRKIIVRHCFCERCMTIWFNYEILKEAQ